MGRDDGSSRPRRLRQVKREAPATGTSRPEAGELAAPDHRTWAGAKWDGTHAVVFRFFGSACLPVRVTIWVAVFLALRKRHRMKLCTNPGCGFACCRFRR